MKTFFFVVMSLCCHVHAQLNRYVISPHDVNDTDHAALIQVLTDANIIPIFEIDNPDDLLNLAAFDATPIQASSIAATHPTYHVEMDRLIVPNQSGGLPASPPAPNWAKDLLQPPPTYTIPNHCCMGVPIINVLGTGIGTAHSEFSGITFEPWLSTFSTLNPALDYWDHEHGVAGCVGGVQTGILPLYVPTTSYRMRNVLFYNSTSPSSSTPVNTYASLATSAINLTVDHHKTKARQTPYLRNQAAVLLFSHSASVPGTRINTLELAMEAAWRARMFVVISAGNDGLVSAQNTPSGIGYSVVYSGGTVQYWPPSSSTSFSLPTPVNYLANNVNQSFFCVGALEQSLALWSSSNFNAIISNVFGSNDVSNVDAYAPGADIPRARCVLSSGVPSYGYSTVTTNGNGTSYSAAFAAAAATRILVEKPWANPEQIRTALLNAAINRNPSIYNGKQLVIPASLNQNDYCFTYTDWISRHNKFSPAAPYGNGQYFQAGRDATDADPDKDGIANLVEYYCGMDPRFSDAKFAPKFSFNISAKTLTVNMPKACYLCSPASSLELETSTNLTTWTSMGSVTLIENTPSVSAGDGCMHHATFSIPQNSSGVIAPKRFFRLKIIL